MMMGLSSMADLSFMGGLMHVLNHALFKSLLFLAAGQVIYVYKTKKVYDIEGVLRTMPLTGIVLIFGMLSITGAPFFNGYVSKSLIKYDFKYDTIKMILFTIINIGTVTSFIKFSRILFGPKQNILIKKSDILANLSMVILAISCLGLGIFYKPFLELIWQTDASYVKLFDLRQWLDYALYLALGYLIYRYIIKKDFKPLKSIRHFQLSFEDANYMLILYISIFFGLMFYLL
jgi:multicomponent Na+:H+ antiporter subunit D